MHGDEPEVLDGTQLAADWTFSGLQKFGQGLMDRLRGQKLPNKLLERVSFDLEVTKIARKCIFLSLSNARVSFGRICWNYVGYWFQFGKNIWSLSTSINFSLPSTSQRLRMNMAHQTVSLIAIFARGIPRESMSLLCVFLWRLKIFLKLKIATTSISNLLLDFPAIFSCLTFNFLSIFFSLLFVCLQ